MCPPNSTTYSEQTYCGSDLSNRGKSFDKEKKSVGSFDSGLRLKDARSNIRINQVAKKRRKFSTQNFRNFENLEKSLEV